jgi:hypothetical protein
MTPITTLQQKDCHLQVMADHSFAINIWLQATPRSHRG